MRSIAILPALDGAQSHLRTNVFSQHFFMLNFPIKLTVPFILRYATCSM